jgi:hypothetical protein
MQLARSFYLALGCAVLLATGAATCARFTVPAPASGSALALDFSLNTNQSEFVFFGPDQYGLEKFSRLDPVTGEMDKPLKPMPFRVTNYDSVKTIALADGGFLFTTLNRRPTTFAPFFWGATFGQFDARGNFVRQINGPLGLSHIDLVQDGVGKVIAYGPEDGGNSELRAWSLDLTQPTSAARRLSLGSAGCDDGQCQLYPVVTPRYSKTSAPAFAAAAPGQGNTQSATKGVAVFQALRTRQSTASTQAVELVSFANTGALLAAYPLGNYPLNARLIATEFEQGILVQAYIGYTTTVTNTFVKRNGEQVYSIIHNPSGVANQYWAQRFSADINGISGQFGATLKRLDSAGRVQFEQDIPGFSVAAMFSPDGDFLVAPTPLEPRVGALNAPALYISRAGRALPLPANVVSVAFAAPSAGGNLLAVSNTSRFDQFSLLKLDTNAQPLSRTAMPTEPMRGLSVVPTDNGLDVAWLQRAPPRGSAQQRPIVDVNRLSATGTALDRYRINEEQGVTFAGFERAYVLTDRATLAQVGANGTPAWERDFNRSPYVIPLDAGVLAVVIAPGTISFRAIDAFGSTVGNLDVAAQADAALDCRALAPARSGGDIARCFLRGVAGGPLEVYGVNAARQIALRTVLFTADDFTLNDDGGAVLTTPYVEPERVIRRVNRFGQLMWQRASNDSVMAVTSDGGAWLTDGAVPGQLLRLNANGALVASASAPSLAVSYGTQSSLLGDDSLLLTEEQKIVRFALLAGRIERTETATRGVPEGLKSRDLRAAWFEHAPETGASSVTLFDWPSLSSKDTPKAAVLTE